MSSLRFIQNFDESMTQESLIPETSAFTDRVVADSLPFPESFRLHAQLGFLLLLQPSQKRLAIKLKLAKKAKQNRPIPPWIRFRTGNTIRWVRAG